MLRVRGRRTMPGMTTTEPSESFQIPVDVAERYESAFVPAFFAQWAPILSAAAGVAPGHRVLDVACGTGIVARTVAAEVMPDGSVIGVDLNEAVLTVARRVSPEIEFRQGEAAALPFESGSFDVVLSQMALMFFPTGRHRCARWPGSPPRGQLSRCSCPARSSTRTRSPVSPTWLSATPEPRPDRS